MKKIFSLSIFVLLTVIVTRDANAYKLLSSKELGSGEAQNQNVVVKCTTDTGNISNQTCKFRRYKKCSGTGATKKCDNWQSWKDLQNPGADYTDWRGGAAACCQAKGLR